MAAGFGIAVTAKGVSPRHFRHPLKRPGRQPRGEGGTRPNAPKLVDTDDGASARSSLPEQGDPIGVGGLHGLPWVHPEVPSNLDGERIRGFEQRRQDRRDDYGFRAPRGRR